MNKKPDLNETLNKHGGDDAVREHIKQAQTVPPPPENDNTGAPKSNGQVNKSLSAVLSKRDFIRGFVPPDYLFDGILQRQFIYALTGQTGHAKTALALLFAQLVGSTAPYTRLVSHRVEHGQVAYFVGENADDVRMRIIGADAQRSDDPTKDRILFIPGIFDIAAMLDVLSDKVKEHGALDLVIVDTSAAYFLGNEELSNTQMGQHARTLRRLAILPGGPCVLVLCHPIKHVTEPSQLLARGGGAFLNEIDGNLTAWKREDGLIELHHTPKFRGPGFEPITFKLEKITTPRLVDSKGRMIPTVRAVPIGESEETAQTKTTQNDEDRLLVALLHDANRSLAELARALGWMFSDGEPAKSRVQRTMERLERSKPKLATQNRQHWKLTDEGIKAAKEYANMVYSGGQK